MGEQQKRGVKRASYSFLSIIDQFSFKKIFLIWIFMIIVFGFCYFTLSLSSIHALEYKGAMMPKDFGGLLNSIYYSFITATTTGYGDISPNGLSKLIAVIEVIFGVIIQGMLISKLVGVKQEAILEEVYNISYEEVIDRLRSGLYLFRADVARVMEKIENNTLKQRELRDMWIIFSGLDTALTNIKNFIIPQKNDDSYFYKKIDAFRLELLLNSIKMSMNKVNELVKSLKNHSYEWRNELTLTSIYYDIRVVQEIIEHESKRTSDKKLIDKLNELRILIEDIDSELKVERREYREDQHHPSDDNRQDGSSPQPKTDWIGELKQEAKDDPHHHHSNNNHDPEHKEHHPEESKEHESRGAPDQPTGADAAPASGAGEGADKDVKR
ncbi:MAG: potassium channel family protein [archaeon]